MEEVRASTFRAPAAGHAYSFTLLDFADALLLQIVHSGKVGCIITGEACAPSRAEVSESAILLGARNAATQSLMACLRVRVPLLCAKRLIVNAEWPAAPAGVAESETAATERMAACAEEWAVTLGGLLGEQQRDPQMQ